MSLFKIIYSSITLIHSKAVATLPQILQKSAFVNVQKLEQHKFITYIIK